MAMAVTVPLRLPVPSCAVPARVLLRSATKGHTRAR
jgi:hypothetical protein